MQGAPRTVTVGDEAVVPRSGKSVPGRSVPAYSSLALVGAHPRSGHGIGGLQSDARSHSPASITWACRYAADSTDNSMTHRY